MENSSNKSDTGQWNSIDEALETIYSLSKVTKGSGPKLSSFSESEHSVESSSTESHPGPSQHRNSICNASSSVEEVIDETSFFGGGRGILLKDLQKQFSRQKLDETIHNELKMIFGSSFSNEAIENHFASACSSSSERSAPETGVFSDSNTDDEHEVDIVVGESNIMKRISAQEKCCPMKKRPPRCRNAIVLSLTQKKNSTERKQDMKKVPELKGPDLFLPKKSYSSVASAANNSSFKQDDKPIFVDNDFPAL